MDIDLHNRFNPRDDQISPVRVRGFTRDSLDKLFGELGFTIGAEIGVAEGIHALNMCKNIPDLQNLLCVDLWDVYYRDKTKLKDKSMQDDALRLAHEKLDDYNVEFVRSPSMDAVRFVEDNSLDFVYIDGDHSFDFVMQDLIEWSKKVKSGGIVSGHDAYRFRGAGVVDSVSVYTHCHKIYEWFVCDEREVSFFWQKP